MQEEVIGRVLKSQRLGGWGKKSSDSLITVEIIGEDERKYKKDCVCSFFAPIYEGDVIACLCENRGGVLYMVTNPFVNILSDKESIIECLVRMLRGKGSSFGPGMARRLYDALEEQAPGKDVELFLTDKAQKWNKTYDPGLLELIPLLSTEQRSRLLGNWHRQRNLRRLYLLGFTNREIEGTRMDCHELYQQCLKNPFVLPSLSIERAVGILERTRKKPTSDQIIYGQIVRSLWRNCMDRGWTATPWYMVEREFPILKDESSKDILTGQYGVRIELGCAYLERMFQVENSLAERLVRIASRPSSPEGGALTRRKDLSPDQMRALEGSLAYPLSVITGGAGTGKTTLIGEIVHNLEVREIPYVITSFTGKAVARLKKVLGSRSPVTLHRMLAGMRKKESDRIVLSNFQYLIVDECSMVAMELLEDFFRTFGENFNVILVGDPNQLPPIEWGSTLGQVLESESIPTFRLSVNHRVYTVEGEIDGVLLNAHAIASLPKRRKKNDPVPPFAFQRTPNFIIDTGGIHKVVDIVRTCFQQVGTPPEQITIVTPYNRDLDFLNNAVQTLYYSSAPAVIDSRGKKWVIGDRVMMLRNSYDINVMNGEEGRVREVDREKIVVDFGTSGCHSFPLEKPPEKEEKYKYSSINKDEGEEVEEARTVLMVSHSYAVTVHKAQGEEYDIVVIFFSKPFGTGGIEQEEYSSFLTRNLIYTALTRAKRLVICIGEEESLVKAIQLHTPYRCENLGRRIRLLTNKLWVDPRASELKEAADSSTLLSDLSSGPTTQHDPNYDEDIWGEAEEYEF